MTSAVAEGIAEHAADRKAGLRAPAFAPAGQSTQMVVGATPTADGTILATADELYRTRGLRVGLPPWNDPAGEYSPSTSQTELLILDRSCRLKFREKATSVPAGRLFWGFYRGRARGRRRRSAFRR